MGFLDKVKETSKQVGDKAQQLADTGQEKFEDYQGEKRIGDLKRQIGELVYRGRTGNAPADADAQIDKIVAEIGEVEQSLHDTGTAPSTPPPPSTGS